MEIFNNIVLNLQAPAYTTVYSPQGQTLSRSVQAKLLDGSGEWEIPENALLTIRYAKPDGTVGYYDTLEDDSSAYSYDGSFVTFGLAAQALTVPGTVLMQLDFYTSGGEKLSTFTFRLEVSEGVFADDVVTSSDYFNVLTANIAEAAQIFEQIKAAYGAPRVAATAAAMTDHDLIYVYTGSESGYTNGNWYYWNGTAWADGGIYNSASNIDATLSIQGDAADAKKTGELAAPAFSTSTAYTAGQYVLYSGTLYRFTADHAAGAWTGTDATAVKLGAEVSDLKSAITQLDDVYVSLDGENQVAPQNIDGMQFTETTIMDYGDDFFSEDFLFEENYYVSINVAVTPPVISHGALEDYKTYCIPVDSNSKYSFTTARFAALSKGNTLGSEAVGSLVSYATEIETGVASYLFLSYQNTTTTKEIKKYESQIAYTDFVVPYWFENTKKKIRPKYAAVTAASMTNDNYIQIEAVNNNLRKGERIVISGDITSFTKIRLNFAYSSLGSTNFIDVTDTYITVKNSSTDYTAHGLTITDNFTLEYEYLDDNTAKITLTSDGNSYTHIYTFVRQSVGYPVFSCMETTLTNVKMTWTCKDLCKNIWVFGDSYVGYATTRWPYYLKEQGYDKNILLDGFPGEGSVNARVSFNNLLQFSVPKFAVWCMGMNDEGDSSTAPSANWVSGRDLFLSYCSANNVTPIFGTIPTVPTINNEQKNAWIRASGYRYIDFAKAVGAQSDGTWFTDMLAQDGVHPTEQGAKALYARVLLDLPEIMIDNFE